LSNYLEQKQDQFNTAMDLYNTRNIYRRFSLLISILIVSLQTLLVVMLGQTPLTGFEILVTFLAAYVLTDLLNGLIHLIMDNNDSYESLAGPLIANFHMHHKIQDYKKAAIIKVYFHETGAKVWLVPYLFLVLIMNLIFQVNPIVLHLLVYIGVLSSVAEVSHYLCHTSNSPTVAFLARMGVLLSKTHHAKHHQQDNQNYAFLNGCCDPLINWIAQKYFGGYKQKSDMHFTHYTGENAVAR